MQRWQTPSDMWYFCLELLLCSPQNPAQHLYPGSWQLACLTLSPGRAFGAHSLLLQLPPMPSGRKGH